MTPQEEKYVHFANSIDNLNKAWCILQEIMKAKNNPLVGAAFQFALVEYSKPYKNSFGTNRTDGYKLDDYHVPEKYESLHKKILKARDQIHAHADLTVKDAKLLIANTASGKCVSIVQNTIHGTEEISNLYVINDLIEQTLVSMYVKAEQLEEVLPLNS